MTPEQEKANWGPARPEMIGLPCNIKGCNKPHYDRFQGQYVLPPPPQWGPICWDHFEYCYVQDHPLHRDGLELKVYPWNPLENFGMTPKEQCQKCFREAISSMVEAGGLCDNMIVRDQILSLKCLLMGVELTVAKLEEIEFRND